MIKFLWISIKNFLREFYIIEKLNLYFFRVKWCDLNKNNSTVPVNKFDINKVKVGRYSYGPLEVHTWRNPKEKLIIGSFVSIARGVKFLLGGNHNINTFMTYPIKERIVGIKIGALTKGPIYIEDDVWIGQDVILLSGIRIGKGAIIGAGSVVAKDIPPFAIAVGNPAKVVKYRFSEEIIEKMLKIDFSKIPLKFFKENYLSLYENLSKDEDLLEEILLKLSKYN